MSEETVNDRPAAKFSRSDIAVFSLNLIFCILTALGAAFLMNGWGVLVRTAFFVACGLGVAVGTVTFFLKKTALFRTVFLLVICMVFLAVAFIVTDAVGQLSKYETEGEKIARLVELIRATGGWSMFVYILIQILQVVILPLPAAVCYIPGSQIWGPLTATLLASAGVLIGSVIAYAIGRFFGKRAVVWIAGKETTEKYSSYIAERGKVVFVLMQILPFFPDDILCMIAGLSCMNFPFFTAVMVLVRPFVIAAYCYLGSGTVIPFSGWGIPVWIAIFVVCIALAVLSFKYQDKFEKWLAAKFSKKSDKEKERQSDEEKTD